MTRTHLHVRTHTLGAAGFTIVELLVVVSIILLMVSILLPSMSRAREVTRRAVCASNQHQVAVGMISYAGDHFTHLPESFREKHSNHVLPHWLRTFTWQYMRDGQGMAPRAMFCPSSEWNGQPREAPQTGEDLSYWPGNGSWHPGYAIGYFVLQNMTKMSPSACDPKPAVPTSPEKMTDGGDKHLVGDQNVSWQANISVGLQHMSHVTTVGGTRLPQGANRTGIDGHVEWVDRAVMGRGETPLEPTGTWMWGGVEKYDHWTPGDRRYYW